MLRFHPEGVKYAVRAWVLVRGDEEPDVLFGVLFPASGCLAFSTIRQDAMLPPTLRWRLAKVAMEKLASLGYNGMYAVAAPGIPGARRFLERLGWVYGGTSDKGDLMLWPIH